MSESSVLGNVAEKWSLWMPLLPGILIWIYRFIFKVPVLWKCHLKIRCVPLPAAEVWNNSIWPSKGCHSWYLLSKFKCIWWDSSSITSFSYVLWDFLMNYHQYQLHQLYTYINSIIFSFMQTWVLPSLWVVPVVEIPLFYCSTCAITLVLLI